MRTSGFLTWLLALAIALVATQVHAEVSVPAHMQAQLLVKVAAFDRNFAARAGENALILLVQKPGEPESVQLAQQMAAELRDLADIAGVPKTVDVVSFKDATTLGATCKSRKPALVYLSAGLDREAAAIATALAGADVLSVGASGAHAENGAVIGFDLEGAKTKIVVNLRAAKAQNVALRSNILKLARIVGS
jgi:hypothetical protein